jgi:methyl-accepting chemotaxis protein
MLIGTVGIFSLVSINRLTAQLLDKDMPGAMTMAAIKDNLSQGYGYIERHVRVSDPAMMLDTEDKYDALYKINLALYDQYKSKIQQPEDQAQFDRMMDMAQSYGVVRKELFAISRSGDKAKAGAYMNATFLPEYRRYRVMLDSYVKWNQDNSVKAGDSVRSRVKAGTSIISITLGASVIMALFCAAIIIVKTNKILRAVIHDLDEGSHQLAAASAEVSSASNALAQGASEQAASLEETSSSLEEMSSMTANNADSAKKAKSLADDMRATADESSAHMREMQAAMDAIRESSSGISQIIKTIDEIAFQTNILALNAAVEAARAGVAGAGFAIVADEVRNLAQRSATSAKETSAKIEGAMRNSEHGVQISSKVASSLGSIVEKTRSMNSIVSEIATSTAEQNKGIAELSKAVSQMDQVTQTNASSAEETAAASEQLNANADSLKDTVGDLLTLVSKSVESAASAASHRHNLIGIGTEEEEASRPVKRAPFETEAAGSGKMKKFIQHKHSKFLKS